MRNTNLNDSNKSSVKEVEDKDEEVLDFTILFVQVRFGIGHPSN